MCVCGGGGGGGGGEGEGCGYGRGMCVWEGGVWGNSEPVISTQLLSIQDVRHSTLINNIITISSSGGRIQDDISHKTSQSKAKN